MGKERVIGLPHPPKSAAIAIDAIEELRRVMNHKELLLQRRLSPDLGVVLGEDLLRADPHVAKKAIAGFQLAWVLKQAWEAEMRGFLNPAT
jgi:hypothetical protein